MIEENSFAGHDDRRFVNAASTVFSGEDGVVPWFASLPANAT